MFLSFEDNIPLGQIFAPRVTSPNAKGCFRAHKLNNGIIFLDKTRKLPGNSKLEFTFKIHLFVIFVLRRHLE